QDPCELRQYSGDGAVRDLVARRVPMFKFAIKAVLADHDLDSSEGRVAALRLTVPMVARIKDRALRDDYARQLAGWVGWDDIAAVIRRVREESAKNEGRPAQSQPPRRRESRAGGNGAAAPAIARPHSADPTLRPQRNALKSALQYPAIAGTVFDSLPPESFTHPAYVAVRQAIADAGGASSGLGGGEWVSAVADATTDLNLRSLVMELAVEPLPTSSEDSVPRYITGVLARLQEVWVGRQVAELKSKLQRISPTEEPDEYHALFGDLVALEQYRRSLLEQAMGNFGDDDFAVG
ncbi:MAG: DNA primase, partial [Aldersonia sp.]|nr:DNA primase [Aldersonia sp.]